MKTLSVTALPNCLAEIDAAEKKRQAQREAVRTMKRVSVLEAYAKKQRDVLKNVHWAEQFTRKEYYLSRAAEKLIYLNYNRVACEAIGHGRYASDKVLMAEILHIKRIARGRQALNSQITFILPQGVFNFNHVQGAQA